MPDSAVEVVSASDKYYKVDEKLEVYRRAGFPLTWVVNPDSRLIRVYASGGPAGEFRDGDTLGAAVPLPGFAAAVADLMPPRAAG